MLPKPSNQRKVHKVDISVGDAELGGFRNDLDVLLRIAAKQGEKVRMTKSGPKVTDGTKATKRVQERNQYPEVLIDAFGRKRPFRVIPGEGNPLGLPCFNRYILRPPVHRTLSDKAVKSHVPDISPMYDNMVESDPEWLVCHFSDNLDALDDYFTILPNRMEWDRLEVKVRGDYYRIVSRSGPNPDFLPAGNKKYLWDEASVLLQENGYDIWGNWVEPEANAS